ncbi:MAG TPA: hypothetical protein VKN82_06385 [Desulfohalobiaceae bacterium]|nr:hypothetical protein [Desulfohalobiaceae bacterium]
MKKRIGAVIVLVIVVLILGHSIICFFQGKFSQGMALFPVLLVGYVFGVARRKRTDSLNKDEEIHGPED